MQFWDLSSLDLCWCSSEKKIWGGTSLCFHSLCKSLKVKAAGTTAMCQHAHGWRGPMQCQHAVTWGSHSAWAHPKVNNPRGAILSGFPPSGCPPILPALTTDQNHSEETHLGALLHKPRSRPHPNRPVTTIEPRGNSPQYFGEARVTITAIKAQIKGISVQACGPTSPPRGKTTEQEELGSCSLQNRPQTQKIWQNGMTKKYGVEKQQDKKLQQPLNEEETGSLMITLPLKSS